MTSERPDPLRHLDLAQTRAGAVLATVRLDDLDRPTPCDEWSVRDVINKMVASTIVFTAFGRRETPDPSLDLVHPNELIGDDPVGVYLDAAAQCRDAWRQPGAVEGMAPSTIGEAKARAVLNARIFDTTILSWDVATAVGTDPNIDDEQAAYVLRIAKALVPAVRSHNAARYKDAVEVGDAALVTQLVATTGRDPRWTAPNA